MLTVPSPLTSDVTFTVYQLPDDTDPSVEAVEPNDGALFHVTLPSVQLFVDTDRNSPPIGELLTQYRRRVAFVTVFEPTPVTLNFRRKCFTGLLSTSTVDPAPMLVSGDAW